MQLFFCEFCELFKNTLFTDHFQASASNCKKVEEDFPRKGFFFAGPAVHTVLYGIDTLKMLSRFPGKQ